MTDIAELVQRLRDWEHVDGRSTYAEELVMQAADALEELKHTDDFMLKAAYEAGFAKAIEMAAEVAEEWFHSADASDLDALLAAIKALKPPQD